MPLQTGGCAHPLVCAFGKESFRLYNRHVALMLPFEAYTPKHHLCFHLLGNLAEHGNPLYYSNWEDETQNRVLKQACRLASQTTFESSTLLRMREILAGHVVGAGGQRIRF